jgi:hypothetical protein
MIQLLNVSFFLSLGWATVGGPVEHHGLAHQPMSIILTRSQSQ